MNTPTPRTDEIVEYLNRQFPATIGHIPIREKISQLEQELNEAKAELQTQLNNIKEYDHHYTLHVQERDTLKRERDEAKEHLDFLKAKGLTVGLMKTSDKPDPYLVYVAEPGTEFDDTVYVNKLIDVEIERDQLRKVADAFNYCQSHPLGHWRCNAGECQVCKTIELYSQLPHVIEQRKSK